MEKAYIGMLIRTALLLFIVAAILNYLVDPLSYFHGSTKHIYFSSERELKSSMIEQGQYDGLILGSSKVTYIQPDLLDYDGEILNAGFSGALPEEILLFLEEKNPDVKWIALGLDYFMFNETAHPYKDREDKEYFSKNSYEIFEYLVSIDSLLYTLKTFGKLWNGEPSEYMPTGARNAVDNEKKDKEEPKKKPKKKKKTKMDEAKDELKRKNGERKQYEFEMTQIEDLHFKNYKLSRRRIDDVKKIQQWADMRGIKLVVWMEPLQENVLRIVKKRTGKDFYNLPYGIKQNVTNFLDLTAAYPNKSLYFKIDAFHYYPSTGNEFFERDILP